MYLEYSNLKIENYTQKFEIKILFIDTITVFDIFSFWKI